eukprot:Gb_22013 [translate_table: standard]
MPAKLGGAFAPKPTSGHTGSEFPPPMVFLRNTLKYALAYYEFIAFDMQGLICVDGKVRTNKCYPAGFMDVVSIAKTKENFRLLYDNKSHFNLHSINCTIRYPHPFIKDNDTINIGLEMGKIKDFIKFDVGNVVMVTRYCNKVFVGVIKNRKKHKGSFEIIHVQVAAG